MGKRAKVDSRISIQSGRRRNVINECGMWITTGEELAFPNDRDIRVPRAIRRFFAMALPRASGPWEEGRKTRRGAAKRRAFIKRERTNAAIKTKPTAFVRQPVSQRARARAGVHAFPDRRPPSPTGAANRPHRRPR